MKKLQIIFILIQFAFLFSKDLSAQEYRSRSRVYREEADSVGTVEGPIDNRIVRGDVRSTTNEIIPLAIIKNIRGKEIVSGKIDGSFSVKLNLTSPALLVCTFLGYEKDTVLVSQDTKFVKFRLKETNNALKDLVVSASRQSELRFESPVSIEVLKPIDLQTNPSLNMYERITNMATVDAITTSVNFKTLNTRGFNSSYNQRFIQRFDNMDLSMPGFNLSLGVLNGPIDLDVERMELIPGANSALYGPNAISGLMNTTSKNPFLYPGISAEMKTGINHIGDQSINPQGFSDFNLRYAQVITPKIATKITFGYFKASDWQATDYRDITNYGYTNNLTSYGYKPGPGNPGYNGLNIGGDEVTQILDSNIKAPVTGKPFLNGGPLQIARTGYRENELFTYQPYMMKSDIGFYFRPKQGIEISWTSRFGKGSSNFQTDNRTQITNYFLQQHKIEVKGKHFTFRSYVSAEDIGEAIDVSLTAINLNRAAKADGNWFMQYLLAYSGFYNNIVSISGGTLDSIRPHDDGAARKFADGNNSNLYSTLLTLTGNDSATAKLILGSSRFEPGTKGFDSVLNIIKNKPFKDDGGRIKSVSKVFYNEFIYDFSSNFKNLSLIAGVNYRLYAPNTLGSVFPDSIHLIYYNEYGSFVQAAKSYLDNRLKFQGSLRVDAFQKFDPRLSPRFSVVYAAGKKKQHVFRVSSQIGFRMPAIIDQYSYMDVKGAITFGGFLQDARNLNLVKIGADGKNFVNLYTQNSVNQFLFTGDSTKLVKPVIKDIAPEELRTIELGWRSFLFNQVEMDLNVYYNSFQNLISAQQYVGMINRTDTINAAAITSYTQTQVYRRAANSTFAVSSYGFSATVNYYRNKKWSYYFNYNMNQLITSSEFIAQNMAKGFNTPPNKINIGLNGKRIYKNLGLTCNFRWVDKFHFAEYDRIGELAAYYTIDLAFNYILPQQKLMFKLGSTNITNNRYIQALGSPAIGGMYYFSVMYDGLLK